MAKRQGFFNRLIMGADNAQDFTPAQLPKTRWGLFSDIFKNRLFELFKVSLWGDLFLLPLVAFLLINFLNTQAYNVFIPYDANIGIGYPVEVDIIFRSKQYLFMSEIQKYLFFIPLIIIVCLGFVGAAYVVRRLIWGEDVAVTRHFFRGIKENWKAALISGLFFSLSLFIMMYWFLTLSVLDSMDFWNVLMMILAVLQFVFMCGVTMFMLTQAVTYKMKIKELLLNSFIFSIGLLIQNTFFVLLAGLPIVIPEILAMFSSATRFTISPVFYIVYAFIGVGYTVLVLSVYAQYTFDKFLNDRIKGAKKNRGMFVPTEEEKKMAEIERIKTKNVVYGAAYVARKLSSIDHGSTITPLQTSYSRADLQRLSEEKNKIKEENEQERRQAEADIYEEIRLMDEKASKKKKK